MMKDEWITMKRSFATDGMELFIFGAISPYVRTWHAWTEQQGESAKVCEGGEVGMCNG